MGSGWRSEVRVRVQAKGTTRTSRSPVSFLLCCGGDSTFGVALAAPAFAALARSSLGRVRVRGKGGVRGRIRG